MLCRNSCCQISVQQAAEVAGNGACLLLSVGDAVKVAAKLAGTRQGLQIPADVLAGYTGAVLGAAIVYIIPALIYTRATRAAGGEAPLLLEPTMLSLGTVIAVLGVYMTLKS